jgi:hypothetical protein
MADFALVGNLSPSTAEDFLQCGRKYQLKHVLKLAKEDTQALRLGRVMHSVFDTYYATRDLAASLAKLKEIWPGDDPEDEVRTLARMEKAVKGYTERWADDGVEVVRPADEETLIIPLDVERGWNVAVKCDKIIKWAGTYRVMEHKTTSQLTANTINRYDPNIQIKAYIWAMRKLDLVPGVIAGAMVDIMCINTRKLDYARDTISMSKAQEVEFEEAMKDICADIEQADSRSYFRPNWTQCDMYGGCEYRNVCKTSPEFRESAIDSLIARRRARGEA